METNSPDFDVELQPFEVYESDPREAEPEPEPEPVPWWGRVQIELSLVPMYLWVSLGVEIVVVLLVGSTLRSILFILFALCLAFHLVLGTWSAMALEDKTQVLTTVQAAVHRQRLRTSVQNVAMFVFLLLLLASGAHIDL
jgi:succinate dehydrogenase/fumarate reductase cytochrome b subunit